ncbi:ABC transporter permease subunit [bacterium]|nr:ABC transporter permease subunit [bacterium]
MKGRLWSGLGVVLPPLCLFAVVVIIWDRVVDFYAIKPFFFPSPGLVAASLWQNLPKLTQATRYTAAAATLGLGASLVCGTLTAFLFSQSRWIRNSSYPYALFLQTVPIVAIAPLIVQWWGRGFFSVALTAFILSLFPILANTTAGLLNVDPDLLDLFRLNNASRWQILWKLRFPNAIPALLTGLKTSCGLAIVGAVVGEYFVGYVSDTFGLGYLILYTSGNVRTAELFATILASTALSVVMFGTVHLVSTLILQHWFDVREQ